MTNGVDSIHEDIPDNDGIRQRSASIGGNGLVGSSSSAKQKKSGGTSLNAGAEKKHDVPVDAQLPDDGTTDRTPPAPNRNGLTTSVFARDAQHESARGGRSEEEMANFYRKASYT